MDEEEDDVRRGPSGARAVSAPVDRVSDDAVLEREPSLETEDVVESRRDLASNTTSTRWRLGRGSESSLDAGNWPRSFLRPAAHVRSAQTVFQKEAKRHIPECIPGPGRDMGRLWGDGDG